MESRLTRWCDGFLEASWLVAILITPLFFNIHSERVFEPDKIALLRSIALAMAFIWAVRFVDQQGWRGLEGLRFTNPDSIWHKPFVLAIAGLILVYLLATLFSVNPRISWSGSYQRLQGTYTTLSYLVFFGVMASTIRTLEQIRRVVSVVIISSVPVALYGMLQHFGHDPLPWGGNVQERVAGHMGNAIFIAAYLIMVIPLTLARIIDAFNNILGDEKLAAADILRSSIYIFTLAIQLLTLYWSGSRGPLIGLAVGLFSFILVLLVSLRDTTGEDGRGRIRAAVPVLLFLAPTLIALLLSKPISDATSPLIAFAVFFGVVALSILAIFVLIATGKGWRWLWIGWISLTILMAGWLLLFNVPEERTAGLRTIPVVGGLFDVLDEWRELPTIGTYGRMLDPSNTTGREKSGRVRVLIWEGVIDLISPHDPIVFPDGYTDPFNWLRPILGYGPESMYTAYNQFYPPELATVESRNASPDRSHNETFDTLVITGLAGLVAWQILYLSVVLFAFRYLGVVRSRRDSTVLIGLWVGGAILATLLTTTLTSPVYLGVAVPVGVIIGVIVYLIYYALLGGGSGSAQKEKNSTSPFAPDRLLMNALIAAVLSHYVEIHFGIAISVTRLYFFAFVGLMFALSYRINQIATEPEPVTDKEPATPAPRPAKRKRRTPTATSEQSPRTGWTNLLVPALLMMLMLGVLGYSFITYALPPDKIIQQPGDLAVTEIFRQSLLQNSRQGFVEWPFVLSLFVLSWGLGWLIFLSEMVKFGELKMQIAGGSLAQGKRQMAAGIFILLALLGVSARFLSTNDTATATLGISMGLIGAIGCAVVALLLLLNRPGVRDAAGMVAAALVILSFPVLIAGGYLPAIVLIFAGVILFWVLWDSRWPKTLLPAAGMILASLVGGFLFVYIHAGSYHSALFYRGGESVTSTLTLRVLEANQAGDLLVGFYIFLFLIITLLAFSLSWQASKGGRWKATNVHAGIAYGSLGLALVIAAILISQTNGRPVQADMVFKRGKPFDDQATRATQADQEPRRNAWDTAIGIYEAAIDRTPTEDFYYLFLGRAYLERAALTEDRGEQAELLSRAETLLLRAQELNPLNTDHTANLARLNTRWYAAVEEASEKAERLDLADQYYQKALALSPQNSIIRNELGRLVLEVMGDCERALAIYDEAVEIDPFYVQNHLVRADAYVACGGNRTEAEREVYFRTAASSLEQALGLSPNNIRALIQLAEIHRQLGEFELAFDVVEKARAQNEPEIFPMYEIDFLAAQIAAGLGNVGEARTLAESALENASETTAIQIEAFLASLGN